MILTTCTQMFTLIHGSQPLDATRTFTTLSLVMLLAGPVGNLIHAVPMFPTALASVDRIQAFLKLDEVRETVASPRVKYPMVHRDTTGYARKDEVIELEAAIATSGEHSHSTSERSDICLTNVSVQLGTEQKAVLINISVKTPHSSLTLILGPVGCGKTTLLRALVGDVPLSAGRLQRDLRSATSAYRAQNPWLPSDTLDSLVVGPNEYDEQWLSTVVEACALGPDLSTFHDGLQTLIGSNGVSLSGGQRQRLALARALYTRQSLLVVDDALSGLDANTANHVFFEVFGPSGLCKVHNVTAVVVTNEVKHLSQADHIILLGTGGRLLEQGGPEKLLRVKGHAQAITASSGETSEKRTERGAVLEVKPKLATSAAEDKQHNLARRTGDVAVSILVLPAFNWLAVRDSGTPLRRSLRIWPKVW